MAKSRREHILATVDDAVSDLLYYDRKEDEDLPRGSIEDAVADHEISVDEMVETFRAALIKGIEMAG